MEIEETSDEDEEPNMKQNAGTGTDDEQKQQTEQAEMDTKPQEETTGEQESGERGREEQTAEEETVQEPTEGEGISQEPESGEKEENVENTEDQAETAAGGDEEKTGVFCYQHTESPYCLHLSLPLSLLIEVRWSSGEHVGLPIWRSAGMSLVSVVMLFPQARSFIPHCLSSPRCVNGCWRS